MHRLNKLFPKHSCTFYKIQFKLLRKTSIIKQKKYDKYMNNSRVNFYSFTFVQNIHRQIQ